MPTGDGKKAPPPPGYIDSVGINRVSDAGLKDVLLDEFCSPKNPSDIRNFPEVSVWERWKLATSIKKMQCLIVV